MDSKIRTQKEALSHLLNSLEGQLQWWEAHTGPSWRNRLHRLLRFRQKYLLYAFSKLRPYTIMANTFFDMPIKGHLPEHWSFLLFGILPYTAELKLTKFILSNLGAGEVFFDVGANVGFYTLLGHLLVGSEGEVHAFEPNPATFRLLKSNVSSKARIFPNNVALSSQSGSTHFYTHKAFSGSSSLKEPNQKAANEFLMISVPTTSIDQYCKDHSVIPTFLKIDVEGGEGNVINGARSILQSANPTIALEIWRENNEPHLQAVTALLSMGYRPYRIELTGELSSLAETLESIISTIPHNQDFDNFILRRR